MDKDDEDVGDEGEGEGEGEGGSRKRTQSRSQQHRSRAETGSRPVLVASHRGVTVTVRFNLRPSQLQREAVEAVAAPLWEE